MWWCNDDTQGKTTTFEHELTFIIYLKVSQMQSRHWVIFRLRKINTFLVKKSEFNDYEMVKSVRYLTQGLYGHWPRGKAWTSVHLIPAGKCTCHLTPHSLEGSWALRLAVSLPPCQPLKEIPASWLLPGLQSHPAVDILPLAHRHTVAKLWKGWSLPGRLHKQFLNLET